MSDEQEHLTHHPSPVTHHPLDRNQLRLSMRRRRNAVPKATRNAVAGAIARHLTRAQVIRYGQRIAVYSAFDGEIDLAPAIRYLKRAGGVVYAPRIVNLRARRMEFVEVLSPVGLVGSCKGSLRSILEPRIALHRSIDPRRLDVVLVPLVAFDAFGWRLGFGAGFYDRKFAFMRRGYRRRPILIGVGYELQRVPRQEPSRWDVPLNAVVTERGIHRFSRRY